MSALCCGVVYCVHIFFHVYIVFCFAVLYLAPYVKLCCFVMCCVLLFHGVDSV